MRTIRWGILGCGDVCEVKAGPGFQKATNSALVAVMRRDGVKAQDFAKRHQVPRWYDDAQKLIDDPDVDAVYIASPPSSHVELALQVARAKKPCLVEKPMARNAAECRAMVDAFRATGTPLWVAYYRRAMPIFVRVKEIVDSGQIGAITGASYRFARPCHRENLGWRGDATIAGGALTLDLGSHALNAIDWIVGPLEAIGGHSVGTAGIERTSSLLFRTANGSPGTMQFNLATDTHEEMIEISGTEGRLRWPCFGNVELTIERGKSIATEKHPPGPHVHQPLIQSVVDELNCVGRCPSDAASAMRTTELLDVAMAGARSNQPT